MSAAITTNIGIFFLMQAARLPFKCIYILSDIMFLFVYHVFAYRKKIVTKNLQNSFPEKENGEIAAISKKYYRHLCDLILETIKMRGMSEKDFQERMIFKNPELVNNFFEKGRSVVVLTMHYNNWEWSSCVSLSIKHKILGVYKPLHNAVFDKYLNETRGKMGSELVQNSLILRRVITADKKNEPVFTWLAADQTPPCFYKFWITFLNQETVFYPGPASISKRFNQPVFFQIVEKTARGHYQSSFELLFENPQDKTEAEIMKAYIKRMDEVIKQKPEYYLWSHRRWKHQRPGNVELRD